LQPQISKSIQIKIIQADWCPLDEGTSLLELGHHPLCDKGGSYIFRVFPEQGVAMLSSILNSNKAVNVNIQIIRIFIRIRQVLNENSEIRLEIEKIKSKLNNQDKNM
jgi:hypothetical protein